LKDGLEQLAHLRARPDDVVDALAVDQALAQHAGLQAQPPALQLAVDDDEQLVDDDRLGQVVGRALAHGGDRRVDRAVGGHDHRDGLRIQLAGLLHQIQPAHARHAQVGQDQVGRELLELGQGLEAIGGRLHPEPLVPEQLGQSRPGVRLVVHDQDAGARGPGYTLDGGPPIRGQGDILRKTCGGVRGCALFAGF
jgi:hypothetical protein